MTNIRDFLDEDFVVEFEEDIDFDMLEEGLLEDFHQLAKLLVELTRIARRIEEVKKLNTHEQKVRGIIKLTNEMGEFYTKENTTLVKSFFKGIYDGLKKTYKTVLKRRTLKPAERKERKAKRIRRTKPE